MNYKDYADQGLKVFACWKNKAPATGSGFYDATDDLDILNRQFFKPDMLVGLPTGAINKIMVVDFDVYKMPGIHLDQLKEMAPDGVDFPDTMEVQSLQGGIHYYYKCDPTRKVITGAEIFGDGIAIDARGDGGYVCAPDFRNYIPVDIELEELQKDFLQNMSPAPEWVYTHMPKSLQPEFEQLAGYDPLPQSEFDEIKSALKYLSSDNRDLWVNFALALKNTGSPRVKELWLQWSKKSDKFDDEDCERVWKTAKPTGDITIATIFHFAQKAGWESNYKSVGQIDLSTVDEKKNHEKKPFPAELLKPPGLVGDIIDHISKFSKKPQPILALAASLAACGAIMGQRYQTDQGLRTNLYILGVGESGCGKEAARSSIKMLYEAAGIGTWSATEDIASDAAILTSIELVPSQVFLLDEIGRFLKMTNNNGAKNAHLYNVVTVLLKIYGSANQTYRGKIYAEKDKQKIIESPNLCIYGTTTPGTLMEGLNVENITDGFLSRFMIFESETPNPPPSGRRKLAEQKIDTGLVQTVKNIVAIPRNIAPSGNLNLKVDPMIVPMTERAENLHNEYELDIYNRREKLKKDERIDTTYNRAVQFAEQIALIVAIGRDYERPIIEESDMVYAINLINYLSDRVHHIAEHHIARNEHEHEGKRVLNIIRNYGQRGITQSELTRRTQNLRKFERDDIIQSLIESEQITFALSGKAKFYYPLKEQHQKGENDE